MFTMVMTHSDVGSPSEQVVLKKLLGYSCMEKSYNLME